MSTPPPTREPHQAREIAESFGSDAERYDRTRPRYPETLVDRIVAGRPGPSVLDVGCGTGIDARQFQAAGGQVLEVEPDARMADFARQTGVEVEVATFEAWDPAGRDFDAVVAGQAWHWVDPVAGAAKAAQVLRPGGRLWLDQVPTFGGHSRFPPEAPQELLAGIGAAADAAGGSFMARRGAGGADVTEVSSGRPDGTRQRRQS